MLKAITLLLIFQLIGETLVRAIGVQIPGPVVGMALFLGALLLRYRVKAGDRQTRTAPDWLGDTADGLLKHLSLLFVPASVGLVQHLDRLESEWLAIGMALFVSTAAAIAVGALTFVLVARWTDHTASGAEVKDGGPNNQGDKKGGGR
jgi:holin-like protein